MKRESWLAIIAMVAFAAPAGAAEVVIVPEGGQS